MTEPAIAGLVHELDRHGRVDRVALAPDDAARRRLRVVTERGADLAIALDRDEPPLADGAVLVLDTDRAVVVQLTERRWLRLRPATVAAALAVGHRAGHLHWIIRLDGDELAVALETLGEADLEWLVQREVEVEVEVGSSTDRREP
jgi:urease accessory protein